MSNVLNIDKKTTFNIGLISAMPEELGNIIRDLKSVEKINFGDLEIFKGLFHISKEKTIKITTAWSGWGKVSAARTTTRLISLQNKLDKFEFLLFTGVAGAIDKKLTQWDIVIADSVLQHDMDAQPLCLKYVIPSINKLKIHPSKKLTNEIYKIISFYSSNNLSKFKSVHKGLIATGDSFINSKKKIRELSKNIEGLLAVEMEGAAFAQVAYQENINWVLIRTISDNADGSASDDFKDFINEYKFYSWEMIKTFLINYFN